MNRNRTCAILTIPGLYYWSRSNALGSERPLNQWCTCVSRWALAVMEARSQLRAPAAAAAAAAADSSSRARRHSPNSMSSFPSELKGASPAGPTWEVLVSTTHSGASTQTRRACNHIALCLSVLEQAEALPSLVVIYYN